MQLFKKSIQSSSSISNGFNWNILTIAFILVVVQFAFVFQLWSTLDTQDTLQVNMCSHL
jgi:hypothetical protein